MFSAMKRMHIVFCGVIGHHWDAVMVVWRVRGEIVSDAFYLCEYSGIF